MPKTETKNDQKLSSETVTIDATWTTDDVVKVYTDVGSGLHLPLKRDWQSIDVDDYTAEWKNLMLRVEQMDRGYWWWAVHIYVDTKHHDTIHGGDLKGFPVAKTWQDACYFCELLAEHLDKNRSNGSTLSYLSHVKLGSREQKRRSRDPKYRFRGPRFADFPDRTYPKQ